uniref:Uncharacterized protein n=1 Tax=Romanomermis culicivorax TaxID=13658 RepID=A0A915IKU2_ROMCU
MSPRSMLAPCSFCMATYKLKFYSRNGSFIIKSSTLS